MRTLKYFLTLMTGTSLGLIAGYVAGTQKKRISESHIAEELRVVRDSLVKAGKKDLEELKTEYNRELEETVSEAKQYLDQLREQSRAKS